MRLQLKDEDNNKSWFTSATLELLLISNCSPFMPAQVLYSCIFQIIKPNAIIGNSKKPFIIDAVVNSGELSLPAHIGMKQILGFCTSKAKEVLQVITGDTQQWDNLKKELKSWFD